MRDNITSRLDEAAGFNYFFRHCCCCCCCCFSLNALIFPSSPSFCASKLARYPFSLFTLPSARPRPSIDCRTHRSIRSSTLSVCTFRTCAVFSCSVLSNAPVNAPTAITTTAETETMAPRRLSSCCDMSALGNACHGEWVVGALVVEEKARQQGFLVSWNRGGCTMTFTV
jgi:hypothetical protein